MLLFRCCRLCLTDEEMCAVSKHDRRVCTIYCVLWRKRFVKMLSFSRGLVDLTLGNPSLAVSEYGCDSSRERITVYLAII